MTIFVQFSGFGLCFFVSVGRTTTKLHCFGWATFYFWKPMAAKIFMIFIHILLIYSWWVFCWVCPQPARKSTNATDTVNQIWQKLFSLFASGQRQANFCAAFTPPNNYFFSRRELTTLFYLFSRVASTIGALIFSGLLFNCLSWYITAKISFSLVLSTAVHIYELFHIFIITILSYKCCWGSPSLAQGTRAKERSFV